MSWQLLNEAIQYLCVVYFVMYGGLVYIQMLSCVIFNRNYNFDKVDLLNSCVVLYLLAAGLPSLKFFQ